MNGCDNICTAPEVFEISHNSKNSKARVGVAN